MGVGALSSVLAAFGKSARKAIDQANELNDLDTADLFTEVSRGIDKWLWFVEAHLQAEPPTRVAEIGRVWSVSDRRILQPGRQRPGSPTPAPLSQRLTDVVPQLDHRFGTAIVLEAEYADAGRVAEEDPPICWSKTEPTGRDHPNDVAAGER